MVALGSSRVGDESAVRLYEAFCENGVAAGVIGKQSIRRQHKQLRAKPKRRPYLCRSDRRASEVA